MSASERGEKIDAIADREAAIHGEVIETLNHNRITVARCTRYISVLCGAWPVYVLKP